MKSGAKLEEMKQSFTLKGCLGCQNRNRVSETQEITTRGNFCHAEHGVGDVS